MNDGNGWEHIIDLLILLNADEELIEKIKKEAGEINMNNEILSYREIDKLYGNLEYRDYKTEMFGNMFYVYKIIKRKFRKSKRENCIELCCACGVHKQTFIDILKSYNFREVQDE